MRLKDCSTLQSIPSLRQREHAAAGVCTMSHRSWLLSRRHQYGASAVFWVQGTTIWARLFRRVEHGVRRMDMWLTFCCLHSLQAFRLPPRRLPVTGGVFSISPDSGLLCMKLMPGVGRGRLGDRKSPWGIKGRPFGASKFR